MSEIRISPEVKIGAAVNREIKPQESELTTGVNKYAEQRHKLRSVIEQKGKILPIDHEFTQLVQRVSERLGMPDQTELMVIDTEDLDAFFHPESRTIAFTRGFARYFLEQGLELSEDHIAAVLGHELEHAHLIGEDYVERAKSSYFERLRTMQNHAEEYRADAEAMGRLSRAGYNPQAVPELLRAMPLTHGRHDLGHPEQIERVRKLEDRLADDEHPLSNTSKKLTPIDEGLLTWMAGDSEVYNPTEKLIRSSAHELAQILPTVETQQQFWEIYQLKKHIDRVAATKTLTVEESQNLERLAAKLMVYDSFVGKQPFVDGQPVERDSAVNNSLIDEKGGISDEESTKVFYAAYPFSEGNKAIEMFRSSAFRQSVAQELPADFSLDPAKTDMATTEGLVDRAIKGRLDLLATKSLSEDEQKFYGELQRCFESGQVSQDLFLTLYSSHDLKYQTDLQQESTQRNKERGLRDSGKSTTNLIDLRDPDGRARVLDQVKFALANSLIKAPEPSPETINLLGSTISRDTGLDEQEAGILARTILKGEDAGAWVGYLQTQDKESLKGIVQGMKTLEEGGSDLRFSPLRSFHQSYLASKNQIRSSESSGSYANGVEYGLDASGLTAIKMLAVREFYLRGYPPGFQYDFDHRLPSAEINLTMEEWDLTVEAKAHVGTGTERAEWALIKYLDQVQKGGEIDSQLVEYAREHAGVSYKTNLTPEQMRLMIHHSLWDNTHLQRMVNQSLNNWFDAKRFPEGRPSAYYPESKIPDLSEQERQDILATLRDSYTLFKSTPADKEKIKYGEVPKPEKIASRLLDVIIQDAETQGVATKDASIQAFRQIVSEGVLLDYLSISKETIALIGDYSAEDINGFLQLLKTTNIADGNRQNLIENFQLLGLVSDADRKEVAKKPISETSIKAILSTHGNNSVEWASQNFQQSDLRDIILIGLYEFASEEQKPHFDSQIQSQLTENPDQFKAKRSSSFAFDMYYRDVRVDEDPPDKYVGQGKLAENFPDLLRRRHPFATLAFRSKSADFVLYNRIGGVSERYGSIYQAYVADRLLKAEPVIFNRELPLDQRMQSLAEAAPYKSVVRDIHLEMLLQEELNQAQGAAERAELGRALLPLFTERSSLKGQLAIQVFRAEVGANPQLVRNFDSYVGLLTHHMPEPSLARNYFLNQFENSVPLTVEQLKQITSMRMSSEGKKTEDDSAPGTLAVNRLGELNREEKVKAALWLLGISSDKPKTILEMEKNFDGHLDNFPAAVAISTNDEKEIIFQRLFLGAEGIVDLEAVTPDQLDTASAQRREFVRVLSENMLPDSMPNVQLFRNIFSTVIESSDPSHASRILTKLINRFIEAQVSGKQLPPEEVIAIGLNELGVIGKKVSQSLAELDWVPNSYKKTLRMSQSEGDVVPKRALLIFAEDTGLLDEGAAIRITSFDDLIGAASNKQAALLTVEVNDEKVGLPIGNHKVVGKFKRPSAQKTENINHDLNVLKGILEVLNKAGYGDILPSNFSAQISDAVKRELDFTAEKQFSEDIKLDLKSRNAKRKDKVSIPDIYYASDDVMIESVAPGISLRAYKDLREQGYESLLASGYGALSERTINKTVVTEALSQLLRTGNVHADLHPGNIFVDQQGNLTLIDLGMHEKLNPAQRLNTISLIAGLAAGNETHVKKTLKDLGWDLGKIPLDLKRFNFTDNTILMMRASQRAATAPPEILSSIIFAISKITTYTQGFSNTELLRMLIGAINKGETPKIIAHLI